MAFSDENGNSMVMPVSPMYGGGFGNGGFGDNNGWWIILLFILLGNNGWGGGFGGYGGGGAGFVDSSIQRGFDQSAVMSGLSGIQSAVTSGFGDVQTALCGGFAGVNSNIANGFAQSEIAANARQIADMQTSFGLQSQLAECCCENRLGTADLKNTIATENCADRAAVSDGIRDVIEAGNRNSQAILDKLCALELDGVKAQLAQAERENLGLQNQLNIATVQNGMNAEVDALYNRLKNCPVPSTPVYGSTPIFTCNGGNAGCGCGSF